MTAHGAKDRPLSRSDEARARLAVTTAPGPFDTLLDLRSLLAQALASIDALRTSLAETAGNLPLFDGANASPSPPGYTWTERDVRFELEYAARLDDELRAMGPAAQDSSATVDIRLNAEWHRVRASAFTFSFKRRTRASSGTLLISSTRFRGVGLCFTRGR